MMGLQPSELGRMSFRAFGQLIGDWNKAHDASRPRELSDEKIAEMSARLLKRKAERAAKEQHGRS